MVFGLASAASANSPSQFFAGYLAKTPPSASATVTFTVPTLTCTAAPSTLMYFGLQITGISGGSSADVLAECSGGAAKYFGYLDVSSDTYGTSFTPAPGDVIVATGSVSVTQAKATLKDVTKAKSKTVYSVGGVPKQVEEGISATTYVAVVPKFGTVAFRSAKMDGKTPKAAGAFAYNMRASGGLLQIKTSALNAAGKGWSETFKNSGHY